MMVGPYVRSFIGTGDSFASCGDVICENCSVNISDASSVNSRAISSTLGNAVVFPSYSAHDASFIFYNMFHFL